jgi:hypothetical protein
MPKSTPMDKEAAARIQSHAVSTVLVRRIYVVDWHQDRTGTNEGFKERAQSTADRREYAERRADHGEQPTRGGSGKK